MYGLASFLTTASLYSLIRSVEGGCNGWLAAYALSTCLLGYNHIRYMGVLLAGPNRAFCSTRAADPLYLKKR